MLLKGYKFSFYALSLMESLIVTEFQATEAYSSLDLTKAKYSISRLLKLEKSNVISQIIPSNFNACGKNRHDNEN
jgi:hypothetical protein